MESMTTTPGAGPDSNVASTSSTLVADPRETGESESPMRDARMRICAMASSPEI
jgi:hypothetical protein